LKSIEFWEFSLLSEKKNILMRKITLQFVLLHLALSNFSIIDLRCWRHGLEIVEQISNMSKNCNSCNYFVSVVRCQFKDLIHKLRLFTCHFLKWKFYNLASYFKVETVYLNSDWIAKTKKKLIAQKIQVDFKHLTCLPKETSPVAKISSIIYIFLGPFLISPWHFMLTNRHNDKM
jgi:hypothetical protein